jgi:hypothetical protein
MLHHYFESHPVHVVTLYRLGEIVGNHLATGRIVKWAPELMGLDITYILQMVIKSQALVDFMVEWIETQQPTVLDTWEHSRMYFDNSSM